MGGEVEKSHFRSENENLRRGKMQSSKPYSSATQAPSRVGKAMGPEFAGPKAMLLLGSNPRKDKEAMKKADESLRHEIEKQKRQSTGVMSNFRNSLKRNDSNKSASSAPSQRDVSSDDI